MHITPLGEKKFPLDYFVGHKHAECLVANKILYCIVYLIIFQLANSVDHDQAALTGAA